MKIPIIYDDLFLNHDTGYGHPERPERISAIVDALKSEVSHLIEWKSPRPATEEDLLRVHPESYIRQLQRICSEGGGYLDADTPLSPESKSVARLSAGSWLTGVDEVVDNLRSAIVISRPPGHHAESRRGMGFCLYSNAALAAYYAVSRKDVENVAVFDWDVHHGNGTQHILQDDSRFAYCSIHQYPFYPGTGSEDERGRFKNVLNIPLPAGSTGRDYLNRFDSQVKPFIEGFSPGLLMISAGFDAARLDPLGGMSLEPDDFSRLLKKCLDIRTPVLIGLEGGYDLSTLRQSVSGMVKTLAKVSGVE